MPAQASASRQAPNARSTRRPTTAVAAVLHRVPRRRRPGSASLAHHPARRSIRERRAVSQSHAALSGHVQPAAARCRRALEPPRFGGSVGGRIIWWIWTGRDAGTWA
ncbi:hypothetical protein EI94DRAFT_472697 [Lactarius quietus]|nr:hypothetical protein EI94DRAFT_472697 [Lactarius quietus]